MTTVAMGNAATPEGPRGHSVLLRVRVVAGLGLTLSAFYFTVLYAVGALRVGSAVNVPHHAVQRWHRDFLILTTLGAAMLAGGLALWLPVARRRVGALRRSTVLLGVIAAVPSLVAVVLTGYLVLLGFGEGPHTVPARPLARTPAVSTPTP